jgi:hypothetical protein
VGWRSVEHLSRGGEPFTLDETTSRYHEKLNPWL